MFIPSVFFGSTAEDCIRMPFFSSSHGPCPTYRPGNATRYRAHQANLSFAMYLNVLGSGVYVWGSAFSRATKGCIRMPDATTPAAHLCIFEHTLIMLYSSAKQYQAFCSVHHQNHKKNEKKIKKTWQVDCLVM